MLTDRIELAINIMLHKRMFLLVGEDYWARIIYTRSLQERIILLFLQVRLVDELFSFQSYGHITLQHQFPYIHLPVVCWIISFSRVNNGHVHRKETF